MRYVTIIKRLAKEEAFEIGFEIGFKLGVIQSSRENIIGVLKTRFGEVPSFIVDSVNKINDASVLKQFLRQQLLFLL